MISSSSSFSSQLDPSFQIPATRVTVNPLDQPTHHLPQKFHQIGFTKKAKQPVSPVLFSTVSDKPPIGLLRKSVVPFAASIAILLSSSPAKAGFLSGFSGIESVPGPQLPSIEFLNRFNEENQKKYAESDARFKESPLLKKLLERSKLNKEKNRQEILDKYCLRGAEWGVGDCSTEGMTPDERDNFIAMLKQKAGVE